MKYNPKDIYSAQKQLRERINTIPKKNKQKFAIDLINLIEKAHEDDYENYCL